MSNFSASSLVIKKSADQKHEIVVISIGSDAGAIYGATSLTFVGDNIVKAFRAVGVSETEINDAEAIAKLPAWARHFEGDFAIFTPPYPCKRKDNGQAISQVRVFVLYTPGTKEPLAGWQLDQHRIDRLMSLYERVDGVADAPAATPAPSFAGAAADGIQAQCI